MLISRPTYHHQEIRAESGMVVAQHREAARSVPFDVCSLDSKIRICKTPVVTADGTSSLVNAENRLAELMSR